MFGKAEEFTATYRNSVGCGNTETLARPGKELHRFGSYRQNGRWAQYGIRRTQEGTCVLPDDFYILAMVACKADLETSLHNHRPWFSGSRSPFSRERI